MGAAGAGLCRGRDARSRRIHGYQIRDAFEYCPATAATTPDALAAEDCRKFPPCDTLSCPSNQVPMQLAVCQPTNVAVCQCIPRPVGQ